MSGIPRRDLSRTRLGFQDAAEMASRRSRVALNRHDVHLLRTARKHLNS